jgi:hypothetical protein
MKMNRQGIAVAAICLGTLLGKGGLIAGPKSPAALLPESTLAVLTLPNVPEAKEAFFNDPFVKLFSDPAMKPYAGKLQAAFQENLLGGLEKGMGIKLSEYADLMNGQLTLALFASLSDAGRPSIDVMLALDSGDKGEELKAKMTDVRQRLTDAGAPLKPVTIRNFSFFQLKPGPEAGSPPAGMPSEIYLGQVDSVLLACSSSSILERSIAGATGNGGSTLASEPNFSRIYSGRFKDSFGYGWINFGEIYKMIVPQVQAMDRQFAGNANPLVPKPSAVLNALGLDGLKGLGFNLKQSPGGQMVEFAAAVPKNSRRGIFKLLALEEKDSQPLPRVPDDVLSFQRVRLNLGDMWRELEGLVGEISPPATGLLELFLGGLGKDRDPGFDFKESFFGNLGDDIVTIGLPPKSTELQDLATAPTITLLGSPNPDQLAEALVVATGLIPSGGNMLTERQFQGRKIYSLKIPGLAIPGAAGPGGNASQEAGLHLAPIDDYLVITLDEEVLEGYLRGPSSSSRPLRSAAGLRQSAEALSEGKLTSFRYDNANELLKNLWELGRKNPEMLQSGFGMAGAALGPQMGGLEELIDFSQLPPFDQVAKYFHYSVAGSSSDANYLNYRWFRPTPPKLK